MKNKLALLFILMTILLSGCVNKKAEMMTEQIFAMDTIIEVTVFSNNKEALEAVKQKIKEIEQLMSTSISDSDVSKINRFAGIRPVEVSDLTYNVLKTAVKYQGLSGDAFQVTIYPLVKLWNISTDNNIKPEDTEIKIVKEYAKTKYLELNDEKKTVYLSNKNAGIDLGAIAKGYTADEVLKILKEYDVKHGLVYLGGGIQAFGGKNNNEPWVLGLENPIEADKGYFAISELTDGALVTSGDYQRYKIVEGEKYHHIIDSKTGYPVKNELASVSIWTTNSMDADAISTATFVLGLNQGYEFINSLENVEAMFVTHDKKVILTAGLKDRVQIVDKEFVLHEIR